MMYNIYVMLHNMLYNTSQTSLTSDCLNIQKELYNMLYSMLYDIAIYYFFWGGSPANLFKSTKVIVATPQ